MTITIDSPTDSTTTRRPVRSRRWLSTSWPERYLPWKGRATRTDLVLMSAFTTVMTLGLAIRPIKPFLLASHPVALEFLTGDIVSIGAAAGFARIGELPLWLVVAAGALGMVKFDWLVWWAGRQWGEGMIRMVGASPAKAQRYAERATEMNPRILGLAVVAAFLPGIPGPIVFAVAGIAGMRLVTFMLLDVAGALLMTGLVAGLGYGLGQHAVDMVLVIDRYATWVSLTLIGATLLAPWARRQLRRRRRGPTPAHRLAPASAPAPGRRVKREKVADRRVGGSRAEMPNVQVLDDSVRCSSSDVMSQLKESRE